MKFYSLLALAAVARAEFPSLRTLVKLVEEGSMTMTDVDIKLSMVDSDGSA